MGQDFVKTAFLAAHAADPSARLYLNDYNLDYSGPKLDAVIKLARSLRSEGIPIHGIGTQAHLQLETDGICNLTKPLAALASTGLEIAITELDIRVALPATRAKLAAQELGYRHAVRACMHTPKCVGVTVWGVDDKDSWVRREINGMGAALLFDDFYKKKPAYYGCLDGING